MLGPTVSPDRTLIAWSSSDGNLQVALFYQQATRAATTTTLRLKPSIQALVPKARLSILSARSWARPDNDGTSSWSERDNLSTASLMFCMEHRIIVLALEISGATSVPIEIAAIIADVEFPKSYGSIAAAEFVFDNESVLVIFEVAPHASIVSLTQAQRDDVPSRKFPSCQSYAILSREARTEEPATTPVLALLCREKHTDTVVVMERGRVVSTFKTETIDAQGLLWSPDRRPWLLVWDSAAFGIRVNLFSAFGHCLRQLSIGPDVSVPAGLGLDFSGTGVNVLDWVKKAGSRTLSMLALGDGSGQVLMQTQDSQSLFIESHSFHHPTILKSADTAIWQYLGNNDYRGIDGIWDIETNSPGEVEQLVVSPDDQVLASKVSGCRNITFVWSAKHQMPLAAFIFQHEVRQMIWKGPSDLLVVTADRRPIVHRCSNGKAIPSTLTFPQLHGLSSLWTAHLLNLPAAVKPVVGSPESLTLMLSSTKALDAIQLDVDGNPSVFETNNAHTNHGSILDLDSVGGHRDAGGMHLDVSTTSAGSSIFF